MLWSIKRRPLAMQLRVLIIDDERSIADTLALILEANGFEVRVEYSGEAGVRQARAFHPDILITDVVMPAISGVDAAIDIQRLLPNCKILLLSGAPDYAELIVEGRSMGFEILAKPVHPSSLLSKLRAA